MEPGASSAPAALVPPRLRAGDRVRVVSPASRPERSQVTRGAEILASWGLTVEIGQHAFDRFGHYLAGRDEDRLADVNDALRDPGVRAIIATTGGKGAYRIASGVDVAAARRDPKPLVGFSDITMLHLVLWQRCRLVGFHGPHAGWHEWYGSQVADALRCALMQPELVSVHQDPGELTAKVLVEGRATGALLGGNLDTIGRSVGWACPSFDGAILLIEDVDKHIGAMDRSLTQLLESGCLDGVRGVAVGQFIRSAEEGPGRWSIIDLLYDRLGPLGVPILGGLPIGHGAQPPTVPLGANATLDTATRTLTVEPGVR
ncbi:MAG: LD-carboxypeptidase [Actinobacteria bacterium]|nr:LD-carboxypeptidase [Actinomycetota bacterium]MBW3647632.1 LD-carboxypeptidase [Actinomycetota bacterium]